MPLYVSSRLALLSAPPVAPPALGTPTFVNEAHTANVGGADGLVVNVPTGVSNGDILIAAYDIANTTSTITDPGGWTFLTETQPGGTHRLRSYYRVASSEPASYTWTFSPTISVVGIIAAYRNCLTSGPIDGSPTSNTGASTTVTATGLTTANNNTMLVMVSSTAGSRTYSGSTLTEVYDAGGPTLAYFHDLQATAGASGNKTATLSSSASWGAQLLAIKPSGGV